ncbi:hypothetical protein L248_2256 [Schleiferilactobacillus shenzhenensis LY-73]|uniref:Uncharacterized protein n=1 Tax=Schleiferilactobacillus shenzhenensis LY-73 TaxID=1231336 RepID=U4TG19_9LACO|nr:hypothetical protein L248_2256 [Schleiferilactobacillus shenzhenensis LY-73]
MAIPADGQDTGELQVMTRAKQTDLQIIDIGAGKIKQFLNANSQ